MRHVGQESRFQPVGTFCFVAGCYQALLDAFMFRNVAVYAVAAYNLVVYCYRCGKDGNIDQVTVLVIAMRLGLGSDPLQDVGCYFCGFGPVTRIGDEIIDGPVKDVGRGCIRTISETPYLPSRFCQVPLS